MERMEEKEKWYNPQKMSSYNQVVNLIIGGRGIGKTLSIKNIKDETSLYNVEKNNPNY